jgi:RsiW-degrading membrane proteinase PrsW (M82 family)
MIVVFALISAVVFPLILVPIEHLLNYPYIIEELVKAFAVLLIILHSKGVRENYWFAAFFVGVLFAVSESVLYLANFFLFGNLEQLPERLLITGLLHSCTTLLMYYFGRKNWIFFLCSIVLSMGIHFLFNYVVSGWK